LKQVQVTQNQKGTRKETSLAQSLSSSILDEKAPRLLFVDSLTPIEVIVSFSSLSRWYEQKPEADNRDRPKPSSRRVENVTEHDSLSVAESKNLKFQVFFFFPKKYYINSKFKNSMKTISCQRLDSSSTGKSHG
jgi:hypothetical protein